jgi:hypothetical protein
MSDAHTRRSDIANGSPASSPSRRRLAPAGLEAVGNIGCADVSTARGTQDRSLFPVPPQRSPNDRRPARPQESARQTPEPNPCFSHARLSARRPIKPTSTENEADPPDIASQFYQRRAVFLREARVECIWQRQVLREQHLNIKRAQRSILKSHRVIARLIFHDGDNGNCAGRTRSA